MRNARWFIPMVLVAAATLALIAAPGAPNKISAYGFVGRSGDTTLIADVDMARYRGGEKYIPVLIWLGHTEAKTLHADRSSFTLTDPKGNVQPLASVEALRSGYGPSLISNDYAYYGRTPDYGSDSFLSCTYIPRVAFFANPSGPPNVTYDQVELPRQTFFRTLLYFPNPEGKAEGTYTLSYSDAKSGTAIEVPLTIQWHK